MDLPEDLFPGTHIRGSPEEPRVPIDAGLEIGYRDTGEEVGDRALHVSHRTRFRWTNAMVPEGKPRALSGSSFAGSSRCAKTGAPRLIATGYTFSQNLSPPPRAFHHHILGRPASASCSERATSAPSPTADATRFVEPLRTSPMAKTSGRVVSRSNGWPPLPSRCSVKLG